MPHIFVKMSMERACRKGRLSPKQWRKQSRCFTLRLYCHRLARVIDPRFDIFPDATCEVRRLAAMGEYVVAQGVGRGTHRGQFDSPAGVLPPSGRTMEVSFCEVYRPRDNKILRADFLFDFYDLWRQLTA